MSDKTNRCFIMNCIRKIIVCLILFSSQSLYSQINDIKQISGHPAVYNYSPKEYKGGSQNWCAVQDERGILYFGNQVGILEYDGIEWRKIPVLDGRPVYSLCKDKQNKIWCGTLNDFGFLKPDSIGNPVYSSLGYLIPDSLKPIGKIRNIAAIDSTIYFLSPKILIRKQGNSLKIWKPQTSFYKIFVLDNKLFVYEINSGLKTLVNDTLVFAEQGKFFKNDPIISMFKIGNNKFFISTWINGLYKKENNKIFKFNSVIDDEIDKNPIINAHLYKNKIVLAGFTSGSYILNENGTSVLRLNKTTGLENLLCNEIFIDKTGAFWLCNNYGLSRVEVNSPFRFFGENDGLKEKIVFITKFQGKLYVSTEDKLYFLSGSESNKIFKPVERTEMCHYLLPAGDVLLAAAQYGVYQIKNGKRKNLIVVDNKTCYSLTRSVIDTNIVFVGTEMDLSFLKLMDGNWIYGGKIESVKNEIRNILEAPNGDLWLATLGQGIIRCRFRNDKASLKHFGIADGLPDLKNYNAILLDNEPVFFSPNAPVLRFNENTEKFYPDTLIFNKQEKISFMVKDEQNNLWIKKTSQNSGGILFGKINHSSSYTFQSTVFKRLSGYSPDIIYPDKNGITWFGSHFGLIKYNIKIKYNLPKVFPTVIRRVRFKDSTVYAGFAGKKLFMNSLKFPYANNNIRFEFALPSFEDRDAIKFQYYLEGFEDNWSAWTKEYKKDYTNLFEGEYVFHVRGKDIYNRISGESIFKFSILPPWYRTIYAYFSYFALLVVALFAIDRIRTRQINKKNKIELERKLERQREIEKARSEERKIIRKKTSADFHDELGHLLTKITLFTEMAKRTVGKENEAFKYLNRINKNATQLSSGVKDLIWTLDSDKDSLYETLLRIKDFGDSLFEHNETIFKASGFSAEFENIKVPMEMRRNIILIFKEVMNNCLKYSQCSKAELKVEHSGSEIIIKFIDNGKGFNINEVKKGNGLKNIEMRADKINANLKIISGKEGVTISLIIKKQDILKNNPFG